MLSGTGPREQLENYGIPIVQNLPGVGQNVQDHCLVALTVQLCDSTDDLPAFFTNQNLQSSARAQFTAHGTGAAG
jgi:hypothetical protein